MILSGLKAEPRSGLDFRTITMRADTGQQTHNPKVAGSNPALQPKDQVRAGERLFTSPFLLGSRSPQVVQRKRVR